MPSREKNKIRQQELMLTLEQVRSTLFKYPGVIDVGIGIKETGNQLTEEVVYRVYVTEKKDKRLLTADEQIPKAIYGAKTDVLVVARGINRHEGPSSVENWLQGICKVRKRMYDATMTRQLQDINDVPVTGMQPVQFPYIAGDYWLGLEYPGTFKPDTDKLSLMLLNEQVFTSQQTQAGLIIDEWMEVIPGKEETSGITFHYNQPNATAPQAILLAVSPDADGIWFWEDLVQTIIDTVQLAKSRAVEPEHVDVSVMNHILQAIVAEVTAPHDELTTNPLVVKATMDFSVAG